MSPQIFKLLCKYKKLTTIVGLLGIEPRLFWTKTRRVASYTIGQLDFKFKIKLQAGQIKLSNSLFRYYCLFSLEIYESIRVLQIQ